jgi:hypothetical protein
MPESSDARSRSLVIACCGYGAVLAQRQQFIDETNATARRIEDLGMTEASETYAVGPARVPLQNKDPRGWSEFAEQGFGAHHARGYELSAVTVRSRRQNQDGHGADFDHDRRRGFPWH